MSSHSFLLQPYFSASAGVETSRRSCLGLPPFFHRLPVSVLLRLQAAGVKASAASASLCVRPPLTACAAAAVQWPVLLSSHGLLLMDKQVEIGGVIRSGQVGSYCETLGKRSQRPVLGQWPCDEGRKRKGEIFQKQID